MARQYYVIENMSSEFKEEHNKNAINNVYEM